MGYHNRGIDRNVQQVRFQWLDEGNGEESLYLVFEYCRTYNGAVDRIVRVVPHRSDLFEPAVRSLIVMLAFRKDIAVEEFAATAEAPIMAEAILDVREAIRQQPDMDIYYSPEVNEAVCEFDKFANRYYSDDKTDFIRFYLDGHDQLSPSRPSSHYAASGSKVQYDIHGKRGHDMPIPAGKGREQGISDVLSERFGRQGDIFPGDSRDGFFPKGPEGRTRF